MRKLHISLPLHLRPDDYSPEACEARYLLHITMARINPKGFRQPQMKRIGSRRQRTYRIDAIAALSRLSGKAALARRIAGAA